MRTRQQNRQQMRPMHQNATNPSLLQWDVFMEWAEEHRFALLLVLIVLFLVWKEHTLFWAPHGW